MKNNNVKKGVIIHPDELSEAWIDRAVEQGIDILGIHPVGGLETAETLKDLLQLMETEEYRRLVDMAVERGLSIEYEIHASGWLLDRALFDTHPEYFRENEKGVRDKDSNFCVSSEEAMEIVGDRVLELADKLYRTGTTFNLWMDDRIRARCLCPKCREYSVSDQQLKVANLIVRALRTKIPDAKVSYLAYYDALEVPKTEKPEEGIFLEYAPFAKYTDYFKDKPEYIAWEKAQLPALLDFFGTKNAKVLEYWLDNSLFSKHKKPPIKFEAIPAETIAADVKAYQEAGFETITTFACYLGPDYEALYGTPDITPYTLSF